MTKTLSTSPASGRLAALAAAALLGAAALGGTALGQANDVCSGAQVIPGAGPFPFVVNEDTRFASASTSGDPTFVCYAKLFNNLPIPLGKSVFFTFTPTVTDNYKIETLGSTPTTEYDTIVGVFTGTCSALVPLSNGCNDDSPGSFQSSVSLALNAGTTYTILVSGVGAADVLNNQVLPTQGGQLKLTISRVPINYPYVYFVPSVAKVGLFLSDLNVTNLEGADGTFKIQFLSNAPFETQNAPSPQPETNPFNISSNGSREFVDVLGSTSTFNLTNSFGALLVSSTRRLAIGARTYTPAPSAGTFGQFAEAVIVADGTAQTGFLNPGESGRLIAIRDDNSQAQGSGFRTNVALFNASAGLCPVNVEVKGSDGVTLPAGAAIKKVPPSTVSQQTYRQMFANSDAIRNASVLVSVPTSSTGCKIGGIAYVIDNATNDPFAVLLKK